MIYKKNLCFKCLLSIAFICLAFAHIEIKHPIVIVPGIGGSQIEAKLSRNASTHYWCYKKYQDYFTVWLSIEELFPLSRDCWIDNMKLTYNEKEDRMENTEGVFTRIPGFGNTSGIEWLDPYVHGPGIYFFPLVDSLTRLLGYERGKTLRSAPYDFRYHPGDAGDYFDRLKKLIEETYMMNGEKKIMLLSHSMGVPYSLNFLHQQTEEWKEKYIVAWTTISGVFGGSMKAVKAFISGDGFGIPKVLDYPITLRAFQRTFSSLPYILPDESFWAKDEVIVKTSNRTYTVHQYDDLFKDMGYPLASKIYAKTPKAWSEKPPNVKMFCFHGSGKDTPGVLNYREGYFPNYTPDMTIDDGDGTVNLRSLQACQLWREKQKQPIIYEEFSRGEHNGVLGDARLIRSIIKALSED